MIRGQLIQDRAAGLATENLEEVLQLHRLYGLRLALGHEGVTLTLNGSDAALVTELLRLAGVGSLAEAWATEFRGDYRRLTDTADVTWKQRMRP